MNKFGNKMNEVLEVGKFNKSRVMWVPYLMKNYEILIIGEVSNLELVTCQFANIIDKFNKKYFDNVFLNTPSIVHPFSERI